jgi:hypothetical protein
MMMVPINTVKEINTILQTGNLKVPNLNLVNSVLVRVLNKTKLKITQKTAAMRAFPESIGEEWISGRSLL